MTAPQAAVVIHTDFERGFIRAQAIDGEKLLEVHWRKHATRVGSGVKARSMWLMKAM